MNLLYLSMVSLVFMVSSALSFTKPSISEIPQVIQRAKGAEVALLPVLSEQTKVFPVISAQGAMVVDVTSNVTMYEKNPDIAMLPASTTKIMTAMVAMANYKMDEVLTVGKITVEGQKMGLFEGEKIKVEDLISGLLIYSANDAGYVLAENFNGGVDGFVQAMNEKAKEMNMINTHFENPAGLDGGEHVSTVRDLIRLSIEAMKNEKFVELVGTKNKVVTSVDGKSKHVLENTNELLGKVDGVKGIKTGWTEAARENLVTYVERDNKKVVIAVLGSQDRFGETEELIDFIFKNYEWVDVNYTP